MVVGWCTRCWAAIGGGKFFILGVAWLYMPIWDVLAPQGERVRAGERLCGDRFAELSQLGKRCQMGLLGLGFAPGLVGLGFSWKKKCIIVGITHLHTMYYLINLWAGEKGWMAEDGFG